MLGATALQDFGLALFVGLTTGAYSSIFIASPLLALVKEREPRYAEIRRRLAVTPTARSRRITPAAAATGDLTGSGGRGGGVPAAVATGAGADTGGPAARPARQRPAGPAPPVTDRRATAGPTPAGERGAVAVPPPTTEASGDRHRRVRTAPSRRRTAAPPAGLAPRHTAPRQPAAAPPPEEGPAPLSDVGRRAGRPLDAGPG